MGRLSSGQVKTQPTQPLQVGGGRLSNQGDNPNVEPLKTTKKWEDLNFGEKIWETAKEIPNTLWQFVPPSIRQRAEEVHKVKEEKGIGAGYKEAFRPEGDKWKSVKAMAKAPVEFAGQIAGVITQGIGGLPLAVAEKITGKPQQYEIPGAKKVSEALGLQGMPFEVSSYQQQAGQLVDAGFSPKEAGALVGINAYLAGMPLIAKGIETIPGKVLSKAITTKKVPISETPEGIRQAIKLEQKAIKEAIPAEKGIIPQELQPQKLFRGGEEFTPTKIEKTGISLTTNENIARRFQKQWDNTKPITELFLARNAKILDWKSLPKEGLFKFDKKMGWMPIEIKEGGFEIALKNKIKSLGYDGIDLKGLGRGFEKEIRVYNPDILTQAVKRAEEVRPEILPIPEKIVSAEQPFITGIKRVFGKTEEQQQFNKIMEEHLDKYFEGRQQILSPEEPLNKVLVSLSDRELANYSKFTQGFEVPKTEITPKLKTAVDLWKKVSKEEQDFLIKTKKLTPEQIENRQWKPVEMITGRSREELKTMGVEPQYYPYLAEDLLKKSDFLGTTGKRTKGGYLKRFTGKMLQEDSYIKDPKIAIPRHRVQVFRDKMNDELVNNIRDSFAEKDPVIIKQLKVNPKLADQLGLEEWKPQGGLRFYPTETAKGGKAIAVTKKVESYWIPKEVANELNKFYRPGAIEKFLRMTYDPLIDMWRVSVLNLVLRWLYNNVMGNTMLSILGKTDPLAFLKSAKEMFARTKLGERLGVKQQEIPKGVFMKEYAGGEMAKAGQLGGLAKEKTQFLRPIDNWLNLLEQAKNYKALRIPAIATQGLIKGWITLGKPVGFLNKVVENWFRGAMYISKTEGKFLGFELDKPVPPVEGLKYVNEFLFDYTKLTRTERATFRRALPFYNWMKNITEFSFKYPVNYPLRGLVVGALLQDYVDYINEVNQAEDKTKSILRIKTDMTYENKPLYLNVKSAIPFSDVFRTIPTNFETFGRFLTSNPVSKIIIERAFKINSFTGQPFTQPSEKQQYDEYGKPIQPLPSIPEHLGQQMPQVKLAQSILDTLRYGKSLKRYETGEPKMYRGRIQVEDWLFPIMRYFGISISPIEINKIKQSVERKTRLQEIETTRYERQLETGLEKLETQ